MFTQSSPMGTDKNARQITDGKDAGAEQMTRLLQNNLALNVEIEQHSNRRKGEVEKLIESVREGFDAYMFVFFTYLHNPKTKDAYNNEERFDCNDSPMTVEELFTWMKKASVCIGKPKIFIFQVDDLNLLPKPLTKSGGFVGSDKSILLRKIPSDADRLMIWSTLPQELAYLKENESAKGAFKSSDKGEPVDNPSDEQESGSFLIRAIVQILTSTEDDLLTQTSWINGRVKSMIDGLKAGNPEYENTNLPVPLVTSTLTELFFFKDYKRRARETAV